jgi:hypothetical protein
MIHVGVPARRELSESSIVVIAGDEVTVSLPRPKMSASYRCELPPCIDASRPIRAPQRLKASRASL